MKAGFTIQSYLWGNAIRGKFLQVLNLHSLNEVYHVEREVKEYAKHCIGVWKLKNLKK